MTLIEDLVAATHARLTDLMLESLRQLSTSGTGPSVVDQFGHELRAHLRVMTQVLDRDLAGHERDELERDSRQLVAALVRFEREGHDDSATAVRFLVQHLCDHTDLEERVVLPALRHRLDRQRMATLGFDYSGALDSHFD